MQSIVTWNGIDSSSRVTGHRFRQRSVGTALEEILDLRSDSMGLASWVIKSAETVE